MPIDLDELEAEPLPSDPEPVPFDALQRGLCRVCGKPATSKKATYCEEHKSQDKRLNRGVGTGTSKQDKAPKVSGSGSGKGATGLKGELTVTFKTLGSVWSLSGPRITPADMQFVLPEMPPEMAASIVHPGIALNNQAEVLAAALVEATANNPRARKWLESATAPAGLLSVGVAVVPVVVSARVWYGMVVPRVKEMEAQMTEAPAPTGPEGVPNVA